MTSLAVIFNLPRLHGYAGRFLFVIFSELYFSTTVLRSLHHCYHCFEAAMSLPDLSGVPLTQQERLLKGPALEAPPGITSNFQNPPNGSTGSRAFLIFCIVLSSLLAITRYYGTWSSSRRFFLSDGTNATKLALCFFNVDTMLTSYRSSDVYYSDCKYLDHHSNRQ